jgi:UDP-N-acetylmuramoyl-tripeptide--D-alanyl-D-alanine ligase
VATALGLLARHVLDSLPSVVVAGITGSSGKTSVKDLAAQLVERLGPTVAPAGSFNNEYGLPLTVLRASASTRYLVLEMSARGVGHIAYLCGIAPPRYGVVLNVGRAHAGEFGDLETVAAAKGELVEALPADGVAILNADDPRVIGMASRTVASVVMFGAEADIRAYDVRLDSLGRATFTLLTPEGAAPVSLRLHGAHHVPNALAAAALARSLGLGLGDIADGLSAAVARSRWRMEVSTRTDGVIVINDAYNANPESVRAALDALGHLARDGRAFAVLGHMAELGSSSQAAHEEIGSYAAAKAGVAGLIAVGDEALPMLAGARQVPTGSWNGEAIAVPDGVSALAILRDRLKPGDVVLVKASRAASLEGVAAELMESESLAEADQ